MISKDPNQKDGLTAETEDKEPKPLTLAQAQKLTRYPLIEEVLDIYNQAHPNYKKYVIMAHEITYTDFMKAGVHATGEKEKFIEIFKLNLHKIGETLKQGTKKEVTEQTVKSKEFVTKKNNMVLELELPIMPERKRRKQINFINLHTFKEIYANSLRKSEDNVPYELEFTEDLESLERGKVKTLKSDLLVKTVITELSTRSNPADNDNTFHYLEKALSEIINSIQKQTHGFFTSNLVKLFEERKKSLKEEIDTIYLALYEKIDELPVKLPSKKGVRISLTSEHPRLSILYLAQDEDVHKMQELINYYKFIDIE